jgi:cell division protein FtsB
MDIILIIVLFILAILYAVAIHQNSKLEDEIEMLEFENSKLEDERDIETFEKNKLERKVKKLENDEAR